MTITLTPRAAGSALRRTWSGARRSEQIAYVVGAVLFTSGLVHIGVLIVSGGSWTGPLSMRKAATFGLSFGLTLAGVAWATSFLRVRRRARTLLLGVFTAACVVETALVSMQSWRGVPSHFNFETPFDNLVSMTLAVGGGVIILTALGFGAAVLAGTGALGPAMRLAVRSGYLAFLLALAAGAVMIARGVVEARTGNALLAYDTAGSLKPVHAVAMHAILVLPALAWTLGFSGWSQRRQLRVVQVAVAAWALLLGVVAVESATGISPLAAPPAGTVLSAVAAAALAGAGATALVGLARARQARSGAAAVSSPS